MEALHLATLRLFKALPVTNKPTTLPAEHVLQATLSQGFVTDVSVAFEYGNQVIDLINQLYGRGARELNQGFHKSFAKVRDASIEQLVIEQLVHYLTTYGAEFWGAYDQDSVYVPHERLDVPKLEEGFRLIVIRGLTKTELKERLLSFLSTGAALQEQTVNDSVEVAKFVGFTETDIASVKNREVQVSLYDYLDLVPENPEEFLRFLVYKATGKALVIKNRAAIEAIKNRENDLGSYFAKYERNYGFSRLGEVFHRYKPLWLAFRTTSYLRGVTNQIRRDADENHKPMPEDFLNSVTARLKSGAPIGYHDLNQALDRANIFRKARLAYALKFRTTDADSIMYRIRNGKAWATDLTLPKIGYRELNYKDDVAHVLVGVLRSITDDIRPKVEGKTVFIPEGLVYGLPSTEKQFTGNLPSGTWVEAKEDLIFGIHWTNLEDARVDLDLSLANAEGKYGWDGSYRSGNRGVLFSGDQTDAPRPDGASEVFHIGSGVRGAWLLSVNHYNRYGQEEIPFKIVVGQESGRNITQNYLVDPNKMIAFSNSVMDDQQKNLGIVVADEDSARFYFTEFNSGGGITARYNEHADRARRFLLKYYTSSISLNELLEQAGAKLVDDPAEADVDLSPEVVDKTTFLELLA